MQVHILVYMKLANLLYTLSDGGAGFFQTI